MIIAPYQNLVTDYTTICICMSVLELNFLRNLIKPIRWVDCKIYNSFEHNEFYQIAYSKFPMLDQMIMPMIYQMIS